MKVKDAMHKGVDWVSPDTPVIELAKLMCGHDIGAIPIGENDQLIGMVTDRDIVVRAVAEERLPGNTSVREVMSEKICYCFEDDDIDEAAKIMAEHQVKRLPVLNKDKRMVGIIALSDIGRADGDCGQAALEGICEETGQTRRM